TIVSLMLPYSLIFLLGWIILFIIWYYTGLPIGPGAEIYYRG
ncbi:MAG: AbgT family transporter, partial [Flavisolibacter sp.]|nr:AbgT family transporter [Flavisolibacter sp.]